MAVAAARLELLGADRDALRATPCDALAAEAERLAALVILEHGRDAAHALQLLDVLRELVHRLATEPAQAAPLRRSA
ncbi:hypothetical protein J421_0053 [Gemmatirosa kalamazoonensis]|uniref:Uncharacterized protein n=2 Tax=Gemmatirosa kalamazoonensis TaxID=861299 RepID=W0R9S0_9BACT|nr:hypothetical protein J421_0008 [Gemmatirosa kalamazoonensis]AHG87569.1 hypothetical protein J421_0031 [Gemmatirosa kalamazoonensis]AHG87590.1 hypothetical protein J421_0053 [Gemmatirosa kalamazoonensis]